MRTTVDMPAELMQAAKVQAADPGVKSKLWTDDYLAAFAQTALAAAISQAGRRRGAVDHPRRPRHVDNRHT